MKTDSEQKPLGYTSSLTGKCRAYTRVFTNAKYQNAGIAQTKSSKFVQYHGPTGQNATLAQVSSPQSQVYNFAYKNVGNPSTTLYLSTKTKSTTLDLEPFPNHCKSITSKVSLCPVHVLKCPGKV